MWAAVGAGYELGKLVVDLVVWRPYTTQRDAILPRIPNRCMGFTRRAGRGRDAGGAHVLGRVLDALLDPVGGRPSRGERLLDRRVPNSYRAAVDELDPILRKLERCVQLASWESIKTDWLEIKPVPPTSDAWGKVRESVCAFLNARGGIVLLGIKEEQRPHRHFVLSGYTEANSGNLSALRRAFTDDRGHPLDVEEYLTHEVRHFQEGQVALIRARSLPEHLKFCFHQGVAFRRQLDRDERISDLEALSQKERRSEMESSLELRPVEGVGLEDLSLQRINELVLLINQGQAQPIETIKGTLADAVPFLVRKRFLLRDGQVTTLGVLVCGARPEDHLLFRSQLDAFVDVPNVVVQDKKTFKDNILQLMELGHSWTLRNIMTGVSVEAGGTLVAEYPEKLVRETINNALAHRDYSINRPVQLTIKPRVSISIRNPGRLPPELLVDDTASPIPVRRIFANSMARNPRLADVLKLHNKWEGKGIGMSDLVHFALSNAIDVPHYVFHSALELSLVIPAGRVLDEATEAWLDLLDGTLLRKTSGQPLNAQHKAVLAYLLKSERLNRHGFHTLALGPENNHHEVVAQLRSWGLIEIHPASDRFKQVYVVCRDLAHDDVTGELRRLFGPDFDRLKPISQQTLNVILLAERHSTQGGLNAKQVSRLLRHRLPEEHRHRGDDEFYRAIRYAIERLAPDKKAVDLTSPEWHATPDKMLRIRGPSNRPTFCIHAGYQPGMI